MCEDEDLLFGALVGRSFEERLLLALIDAHPDWSATDSEARKSLARETRLRAAMQAIFLRADEGRSEHPDEPALRWMGSEYYRDKAVESMRRLQPGYGGNHCIRSIRKLAEQAAAKFQPLSSAESLRKKFSVEKEFWLAVEQVHDHVPEALETNLLNQIIKILRRVGVEAVENLPDGTKAP